VANLLIVILLTLSLAILTAAVALYPTRIKISSQYSQKSLINTSPKEKKTIESVVSELKVSNSDLKLFFDFTNFLRQSTLIEEVLSVRNNVKIFQISIVEVKDSSVTYIVQGVSPDRKSLISFKDRLINLYKGGKADLPISSLTNSKDLKFAIKVEQNL
jgi:hypothetical protein